VKLPRRHPRSVYAVCDAEDLVDGPDVSEHLEEIPRAFDRHIAGDLDQDTVSLDQDTVPLHHDLRDLRVPAGRTGASAGRVIGGVLAGAGAASALAAAAIALLAQAGGGAHAGDGAYAGGGANAGGGAHTHAQVGARVLRPLAGRSVGRRPLSLAARERSRLAAQRKAGVGRRMAVKSGGRPQRAAVAAAIAASTASSVTVAAGQQALADQQAPTGQQALSYAGAAEAMPTPALVPSAEPHPINGRLIAELEFGFER
jgi:hypothetical protein